MKIDIRDGELSDMDALRAIFRRASLSNEGDRGFLLSNPAVLEFADAAVRERRTRVASTEGRVVGFASTIVAEGFVDVEDLFVDPDWMRRGVASALMVDVQDVARSRGIARVEVTANRHALAFYESAGFTIDGEVPVEFGTALRMYLDIS